MLKVKEKQCLIAHVESIMDYFLKYPKPLTTRQYILKHSVMNLLGVILELVENGRIKEAKALTGKIDDKLISFMACNNL